MALINRQLNMIAYRDIEEFVSEQWPESKTIDYKKESYGSKDDDKKELLKDVTSFANTQGGDIVIGIEESEGLPIGIPGFSTIDIDKEKLRLSQIINSGTEPRVDFELQSIPVPKGTHVLIIRVKESLEAPHQAVLHGKRYGFWARMSNGKFEMDTNDLRQAFLNTERVYQQIKSFHHERLKKLIENETPMPQSLGGKFVLHLLPVSSFRSRTFLDVANMPSLQTRFPPIGSMNSQYRLNLDGLVVYDGDWGNGICRSYTQVFRNGSIESVLADVVSVSQRGSRILNASRYEQALANTTNGFKKLLTSQLELGINLPIWCFLSLTKTKGAKANLSSPFEENLHSVDHDVLDLPEIAINEIPENPMTLLRPTLDLVWNACGIKSSPYFGNDGKFTQRF
jgi:hypothetical protein